MYPKNNPGKEKTPGILKLKIQRQSVQIPRRDEQNSRKVVDERLVIDKNPSSRGFTVL